MALAMSGEVLSYEPLLDEKSDPIELFLEAAQDLLLRTQEGRIEPLSDFEAELLSYLETSLDPADMEFAVLLATAYMDDYKGRAKRHKDKNGRPPSTDENDPVKFIIDQSYNYPMLQGLDEEHRLSWAAQLAYRLEHKAKDEELTTDQDKLLKIVHALSKETIKIFVEANYRLAVSIARKKIEGRMTPEDKIQSTFLSLLEGTIMKYDRKKGIRFATFATWRMRQGITREADNTERLIRLPVEQEEILRGLQRVKTNLINNGEPVTDEGISAITGVPVHTIAELHLVTDVESLDRPITVGDSGSANYMSKIAAIGDKIDEYIGRQVESDLIVQIYKMLDPRERIILALRFGILGDEPMTQEEVGAELDGLTKSRIGQLECRAIQKIRDKFGEKRIKALLETL